MLQCRAEILRRFRTWLAVLGVLLLAVVAPAVTFQSAIPCPDCEVWNRPQEPLQIFGNTYYVGTHGLTSILIASNAGHVLIDGGLPESASPIARSIAKLGFRIEDVKLILNSHVHFDHAGGLAELQRLSGAIVAASPRSAPVLRSGTIDRSDPQYGVLRPITAVPTVKVVGNEETLRVGETALTAHFTPGHTPGGTSWRWQSCESERCLQIVYADSLTPVSADGFLFTRSSHYREAIADFDRSFAFLEGAACDILLTPHPDASGLWSRVEQRKAGKAEALLDRDGCRRYAATGRERLRQRLAREAR